jgi:SseB protein N-terminal domain/SseB protein C-terminal domain
MIPVDPADDRDAGASAMTRDRSFVRPGGIACASYDESPEGPYASCEVIEQALASVAKDADRVSDLLDELSRARLWVPLPGSGHVVTGSAVSLPVVTYLGAEFVPAFTSLQRLNRWVAPGGPRKRLIPAQHVPGAHAPRIVPHIVVPAAVLARRLPAGLGIALNPGAPTSVPIYPEGVADLAAAQLVAGDTTIRLGNPPAEPVALLREVRNALRELPSVKHASRAWLSVPGRGEGLVISVQLDDPASKPARDAVVTMIERAAACLTQQTVFPIDVTFPGETEADQIDEWMEANAAPFYVRLAVLSEPAGQAPAAAERHRRAGPDHHRC